MRRRRLVQNSIPWHRVPYKCCNFLWTKHFQWATNTAPGVPSGAGAAFLFCLLACLPFSLHFLEGTVKGHELRHVRHRWRRILRLPRGQVTAKVECTENEYYSIIYIRKRFNEVRCPRNGGVLGRAIFLALSTNELPSISKFATVI